MGRKAIMINNFLIKPRCKKSGAGGNNQMRNLPKIQLIKCSLRKRKSMLLVELHSSCGVRKGLGTIEALGIHIVFIAVRFQKRIAMLNLGALHHALKKARGSLVIQEPGTILNKFLMHVKIRDGRSDGIYER